MIIFDYSKPQINLDIIISFEKYLNCNFSNEYKEYLLSTNGGISNKKIFLFPGTKDGSSVHHWYGIRSEDHFSLLLSVKKKGIRYPDNMIAISDDAFGNLILLSVKGRDHGKIYFWDHEMESNDDETPDYSNLTLISDSFKEFMNGLKSEDEIEE